MTVSQLPNISMYWDCDHIIGKKGIQNIFTMSIYQEILQNFHFVDNSKQAQTDKGYKIRPIIDHLNKSFQESYSNKPKQIIDEHVTKLKGRSSTRQYLKMKMIQCGFKWWFRCAISNGHLDEFVLYLEKEQNVEVNLTRE